MRLACLALATFVTGCGAGGSPTIQRTVGGRAQRGIFVSPFSYEHFIRAELAELRGDLPEARQHYELSRAGPEDDPMLIARLADVTDRMGNEARALAILERGDALDPRSELIELARGAIHARHDRDEEAIEAYARAAALAPRSERGPIALAALLREHDRAAESDAVLERYLERADDPASRAGAARVELRLAVERGDAGAAFEAVRALIAAAPIRADEVRDAIVTALDDGRAELALRLMDALPERPDDRPLRLRVALAARDRDRAEAVLATWIPDEPAELVPIAEGYLAIGRPERAAELAEVALRTDQSVLGQLTLARARRAMGQPGAAAAILSEIDPASQAWPAAPEELARALEDRGMDGLADELRRATAR